MDCSKCACNSKCEKPYGASKEYQLIYLGRTYTKEEWIRDGECCCFEDRQDDTTPEAE